MSKPLRALAAAAALLLAWPAAAQQGGAAAPAAAPIRPTLWVAQDADSKIYLYGTVHMRRTGAAWGDARVEAAIREAAEVWTEIEINDGAEQAMAPIVRELGFSPTRPLSQVLTPGQRTTVEAGLGKLNLPLGAVDPMRPWLAAVTVSILPMVAAGYDPRSGVDRAVDAYARAQGKRLRAFETVEQQLRFFADMEEGLQVQLLLDSIAEVDRGPAFLAELERAWEEGDVTALEREVVEEMRTTYPELYAVFFTRRNAAWTDTLMAELAGSGVDFVAVGAGHLAGPDSLITMLRARGVSVERVEQVPVAPRRPGPARGQ